ncbi:MAG: protein translocase subunit SecD [Vicinamibacterales bacterium]
MAKNLRWKVILILGVIALSVFLFYPPDQKIRLGLDLKGGVHLVLRVQTDDALRLETQTTADRLGEQLKTAGIIPGGIAATSATEFTVTAVPPDKDQQFRTALTEVEVNYNRTSGTNGNYTFALKPNIAFQLREDTVNQALQTIERRVNELGVAEPIVARHSAADQILVQMPGVTDVARAKEIIRSTAQLELKQVEQGPFSDEAGARAAYGGNVPPDIQLMPGTMPAAPGQPASTAVYAVRRIPAVTGRDLRNARPTLDENNRPAVSFSLNSEGARKFGAFTQANIGRQLAIVLDGRIASAPTIQGRIDDEGRITGNFTNQEAQDLSLTLRSGALPAGLTYLEERTVGPSLGADSIRAGVLASVGGLIAVIIFMLLYYKLSGLNAFASIAVNLMIVMGLMAYMGATMTLPGIAGFILTIGMGVDSNVLIFERIREELRNGKAARQAVAAGFDRVFLTIIDTHIASLIAAAFLFQFGTGPIRGFATTLFVGLISNVFTAVFVSRTLFELELSRRHQTTLSI